MPTTKKQIGGGAYLAIAKPAEGVYPNSLIRYADLADYCEQHGNCIKLDNSAESQIAGTQPLLSYEQFCDIHPQASYCGGDWWSEDADSKNGFGGRNVADSGNEGSTSAASATEQ